MLEDSTAGNESLPLRGVYVVGAPDVLHPSLKSGSWETIEAKVRALAERGLLVLLVAYASDGTLDSATEPRPPANASALGLVGLADELRAEAADALAAFQRAGVQAKIISGDAPDTSLGLGHQ